MFRHIFWHDLNSWSISFVGQSEKLVDEVPKLAGKCPVTDRYYEHCTPNLDIGLWSGLTVTFDLPAGCSCDGLLPAAEGCGPRAEGTPPALRQNTTAGARLLRHSNPRRQAQGKPRPHPTAMKYTALFSKKNLNDIFHKNMRFSMESVGVTVNDSRSNF